ncbi:MAG: UvrD-helicase domain-containing protein [Oligoflexus sp.]
MKDTDKEIIAEEEHLLAVIQNALVKKNSQSQLDRLALGRRFAALRDEATKAREDDLPALFDQMHTQRALFEHNTEADLPDQRSPYFAHMKLQEGNRVRDILLGHKTFLEVSGTPIIDWRNAPISRIFFNYREGEEFEEELPGRLAEGTVIARRILTIHDGNLMRIMTPDASFTRQESGEWQQDDRHSIPTLRGGAGSASRSQHLGTGDTLVSGPEVSALLDPLQFSLLNADSDEPLLILGGAGCGKTTVALHRIALLHYRDRKRFAQNQMIVIAPEQGLARLSRRLLDSLGLEGVEVTTFDLWIERQARAMIRTLPKRVYQDTPADVVRFKRHPAIRHAFPIIVANQVAELEKSLPAKVPGIDPFLPILRDESKPLVTRVDILQEDFIKHLEQKPTNSTKQRVRVVREHFQKVKKDLLNVNRDRMELFANEQVIQSIVAASSGQLTPGMGTTLLSHSLDQFASSAQNDYGAYDQSKLEMVDGKSLADDGLDSKWNTIDTEDFAVLLELLFYKTDRAQHSKFRNFAHIVIDEAQDLAPIELNILSRAIRPDSAVTIAGDAAQQIDPSTSFESWENVLDELRVRRVKANHLTTSYRSTAQIASFAHKILGPLAPKAPPKSVRSGVPVTITPMPNDGQVSLFLNESLTTLMTEEPNATVAIIAKTPDFALKLYQVLKDIPKLRLVEDGEFDFRPGIDITTADQVKGLEFDYVIVPDAGDHFYKDKPEDRRLLHVAATRAIHQLWVMTLGKPSKIIAANT